jgi:hypothetical protein
VVVVAGFAVVEGGGVAATVVVVVVGVAFDALVSAAPVVGVVVAVVAVLSAGFAPHEADPPLFAPHDAAPAAVVGVAFDGVCADFESPPPQAMRTADVPRAASVAARLGSDKFGRMRFSPRFVYFD